jgi:hypothetical protein
MNDAIPPSEALPLLARLYRERRSGVLSLGPDEPPLRVWLREGQIAGLGPLEAPPADALRHPGPDDSAQLRLDRVLHEIGIRSTRATRAPSRAAVRHLRERLLEALAGGGSPATFEEGLEPPAELAEAGGATEPTLLEAVRRLRDGEAVQAALGDLDQRLVTTAALAEERTLTLTEGYLLSRIDGTSSARQVLQLVPLDPEETERTLLGLLLTGRVEYRPAPAPRVVPHAPPAPPVAEAPPGDAGGDPPPAEASPSAPEEPEEHAGAPEPPRAPKEAVPPPAELDPETLERRREVLGVFQALPLKNHFEVLGIEPGCTDGEVKRAYVALAKRYHPDVHRDPRLDDLHDVLEAIFIRVGEAWEVLGDARSRASYEARLGVVRRPRESFPGPEPAPEAAPPGAPGRPTATRAPAAATDSFVAPEETLSKAQVLLAQARYWDAIQMLEAAVPQMEPRRAQHRGRILLAKAYAKNPNWVRRAEETLHDVVREDPANAEAHYELGLIYKAGGLPARAQAMFRRVVELRPDHREAAAELDAPEAAGGGLLKRLFGKGRTG